MPVDRSPRNMPLKIGRRLALAIAAIGLGGCSPQSEDGHIIVIPCGFLFACLPSDGYTGAWEQEDRQGDRREPAPPPAGSNRGGTPSPGRPSPPTPGPGPAPP